MKQNSIILLILLLCGAGLAATDQATWRTRMQEANLLDREGRYGEARTLYLAAVAEAETLPSTDRRLAESLNNLAAHYFHCGKYAQAEPLYRRALELWKVLGAEEKHDLAVTMNNLAALYRAQGRYPEGESLYVEALRLLGQTSGAESVDAATGLNNLAELYRSEGKYEKAESTAKRSLSIAERTAGPDSV